LYAEVGTANPEEHELVQKVIGMERMLSDEIIPQVVRGIQAEEVTEMKGNRKVTRNREREAAEFLDLFESILIENGLLDNRGEN
jgi:hypothetical protein